MTGDIGYPQIKRLYECLYTDPDFIEKLQNDPRGFARKLKLGSDPARILDTAEKIKTLSGNENPFIFYYGERMQKVSEEITKKTGPDCFFDKRLYELGRTVKNRMSVSSFRIRLHPNVRYYPVMFELTQGCSQHCPFCGFDAKDLSGVFSYNSKNSVQWKQILGIIRDVVGPAAGMGICYFATEPFDNPDYEQFINDFRDVFGRTPQTTTALGLKDPQRLRRFISTVSSHDMYCGAVRISVRSLEEFYRVMSEYSPEELADIEIIANNPESSSQYSASGRKYGREEGCADYSICCLAGLRVNMASGTVCFEEPEMPDEDHPTGERIYETLSFSDASSFEKAVRYLSDRYAFDGIKDNDTLYFDRCVKVEINGNEVLLSGDGVRLHMTGNNLFIDAVRLIKDEKLSAAELAEGLNVSGFVKDILFEKLVRIYKKGYLRILPEG